MRSINVEIDSSRQALTRDLGMHGVGRLEAELSAVEAAVPQAVLDLQKSMKSAATIVDKQLAGAAAEVERIELAESVEKARAEVAAARRQSIAQGPEATVDLGPARSAFDGALRRIDEERQTIRRRLEDARDAICRESGNLEPQASRSPRDRADAGGYLRQLEQTVGDAESPDYYGISRRGAVPAEDEGCCGPTGDDVRARSAGVGTAAAGRRSRSAAVGSSGKRWHRLHAFLARRASRPRDRKPATGAQSGRNDPGVGRACEAPASQPQ